MLTARWHDSEAPLNDSLHISELGLALQKRYEKGPAATCPRGFAPKVYFCPAGKPTIGWGHVITEAEMQLFSATLDEQLAEGLLKRDNIEKENSVKRLVRVPLLQCQFDALVDWMFNVGEGNAATSTLIKMINRLDYAGAADQFLVWDKYRDPKCGCLRRSSGLSARRYEDRALFLGGVKHA